MPAETNMVPAHGADSLETAESLRALAGVYQPYTVPGAMTNGEVLNRLKSSGPGDSVLALSAHQRKALVSDQQDVVDAADAATGANEFTLTAGQPGNLSHEWTVSDGTTSEVLGAESTAFDDYAITARKPKLGLESIIDQISERAKAAGKNVLIIVNRQLATVKVIEDTAQNIATKYAALVAAKENAGCFATIDGDAPPAEDAAVVYLN